MRALRIHKTDDGSEARLQDVALDELTAGEVVIAARYSSVNYKDALAVTGKGKILRRFPLNGGIDVAGVVESSEDDRFAPGDEVLVTGYAMSEERDGGYAEYVRIPADCVVPRPKELSLFQCMALGTAGFTAGFAFRRLRENRQAPEQGPILVTGATGGVGSFAVDILSNAGYEVVAATRKTDTAGDYLRGLGAAEVISPEAVEDDGKPLSGARWGGAVDNVGGALLERVVKQVVPFGNIAAIGLAGGVGLKTTVLPFILRGVSLVGIHSVECPMDWRREIWADLAGPHRPANLDSVVKQTVGLRDLKEVCESMLAGETLGRTVVDLHKE
ncbi:quinone oxidoreductase, YhdH/YhfP family protein [Salinisphaera sp. PC39]|uniref:YhdH/YhfP family quinone oxidoreductase n=1 Tax=Salinisphaera sp. PC39 TaxID=1304156 RepID=UPI0033413764